jgi:L-ascorbate metabolism protein UlaG (beta-lactamase superfamily)
VGFVVDDGETRFYHAGDTGLFGDMRTVIRDMLQPHVAAVPIGDHYTMGPEHAARAVEWLGVNVAVPMHYDTFDAIKVDAQEFVRRVGATARVVVPPVDGGFEMRGAHYLGTLGEATGLR